MGAGVRLRAGAWIRFLVLSPGLAPVCRGQPGRFPPGLQCWSRAWDRLSWSRWSVPVLGWLFRRIPERIGTILLSALVAHSAWHWMTERGSVLRQYRFEWPALDVALAADVMRALMLVLIVAGAAWLMLSLARRLAQSPAPEDPAAQRLLMAVLCALALPTVAAARQGVTDSTRSTWSGVYTEDQATRGKDLYAMHCSSSCHSAATHTGAEFTAKWEGRHSGSSSVSFANRCPRANRGASAPVNTSQFSPTSSK